jgi:hypothetical protein
MTMAEWKGWAVIEEGHGIVYVRQEHHIPEVGRFAAEQEARIRTEQGCNVRLARVRIIEEPQEAPK